MIFNAHVIPELIKWLLILNWTLITFPPTLLLSLYISLSFSLVYHLALTLFDVQSAWSMIKVLYAFKFMVHWCGMEVICFGTFAMMHNIDFTRRATKMYLCNKKNQITVSKFMNSIQVKNWTFYWIRTKLMGTDFFYLNCKKTQFHLFPFADFFMEFYFGF